MTPTTSWLGPVADSPWAVRTIDVPGVHCTLGVPTTWESADPPAPGTGETVFAYLGASPVEWLTVRYKADASGGALGNWVDGTLRAIGFPVIPPSHLLVPLPRLLQWAGGPLSPADSERLGVDELLGYQGSAEWVAPEWVAPQGVADSGADGPASDESASDRPPEKRRLRLYVVLARRGEQAWHVALGMDTAILPGMPPELIEHDDHARAAAVFSRLHLA